MTNHGNNNSGFTSLGNEKILKEQTHPSPTPPTQRRLAKSFSVTPSAVTKGIINYIN